MDTTITYTDLHPDGTRIMCGQEQPGYLVAVRRHRALHQQEFGIVIGPAQGGLYYRPDHGDQPEYVPYRRVLALSRPDDDATVQDLARADRDYWNDRYDTDPDDDE